VFVQWILEKSKMSVVVVVVVVVVVCNQRLGGRQNAKRIRG
jgi:hypothetical protein